MTILRYIKFAFQTRRCPLTFPIGTPQGDLFISDTLHLCHTIKPFLQKWTRLPDDYDQIYQHMLEEAKRPDLVGRWTLLTIWGTNPPKQ